MMKDWTRWFQVPEDPSLLLWGTYEPWLVGLSLCVAVFSSVMALQTAAQAREQTRTRWRQLVLLSGAFALGGGVWAMHFVGMLAFDLCMPVRYDPFVTALSMLPSVAASWVALALLARPRLGVWPLVGGGVLVGAGIGTMHYSGMAAMRMAPQLRYDPLLFTLSIVLAVGLAVLALWVRFGLAQRHPHWRVSWLNTVAGLVMGLAIAGMHYLGMAAARFVGPADTPGSDSGQVGAVALGIAAIVLMFTALVVGVTAYLRQRQLMLELTQREEEYRSLVSNLPGAVLRVRVQPSWPVEFASEKIHAITGCERHEFVGQPLFGGVMCPLFPADLPLLQAELDKARASTLNATLDYRIRHRNGPVKWVSLHVRMLRGSTGHIECMDVLVFDISDRKLAEMDLLQAQAIIRSSDDAIVSKTTEGIITSWNQGAERVFGYHAAEAIGQPMLMLFPQDRVDEENDILRRIKLGQKVPGFETVRRRKDGQLIDVSVTLSPILDEQGEVVGASKIARDISDRKRNEQLQAAKDKAEQAAAARTAFLANMSHELRTPMNAVIGFTKLLLDTTLTDEQRKHLNTVHNSAESLLQLLNDILDTTKLDKGVVELEMADFDLMVLLRELEDSYGMSASQKDVAFRVVCDETVKLHYRGDSLRVRQVLINVLGNAIKFTERGEVKLILHEEGDTAPRLHITVQDTGIGMSAEQLSRIFDPFTQADASMSRRFGGTGLGTTISKQLVELMGGQIWAESTLGVGTTFHVVLPLAYAHNPFAELPENLTGIALPPLRLLLVDDVSLNLQLLALLMKKDQHEVVAVNGGELAVQKATQEHFDLVLMDVQMPEVTGLEATERIRAFEAAHNRPRMPIVALTASVLLSDRQAAQDAGMDGFATKPIEPKVLKAEMARVLGLWQDAKVPEPALEPVADHARLASAPPDLPVQWTLDTQAAAPCDPAQAHACAQVVRHQLLHGEWEDEPILSLQHALGRSLPVGLWSTFRQSLAAFEFEQALAQLDGLMAQVKTTESQP
jgi:PAS domain S-box-containing protein